jgi:predicted esterase
MTAPDLGFVHVYRPPAVAGAPTLLLLHGTGGDEHDLLPLVPMLLPAAGALSPRGQVLEHGQARFFRRVAPGVFDLEDLARRTAALAAFVREGASAYGFDPARVIAVGMSNGANIAVNLLLTQAQLLRAAVLFRAMVPVEPAQPPSLEGVSVYINGATRDELIAPRDTERLAKVLRDAGAHVTLEWDEAGHGLTRNAVEAAHRWISSPATW